MSIELTHVTATGPIARTAWAKMRWQQEQGATGHQRKGRGAGRASVKSCIVWTERDGGPFTQSSLRHFKCLLVDVSGANGAVVG